MTYNVEMVEVTGGEFWQPYDAGEGRVSRPPIGHGQSCRPDGGSPQG